VVPSYFTTTVNAEPRRSSRRGVTVSSWPSRANDAARPSTVTDRTSKPRRSRLKRDRPDVERAEIVATPENARDEGVYRMFRS
jgi:hypothetical protein